MDFFTGNGADKPKSDRPKPWYRSSIGLLLILVLIVATVALILSALQLYYSPAWPR